ncbi:MULTISPECIES: rhodanese-like domain-containing protein [Streptomyces]|uniref:Rhodanese-like domain-containing protein n=1 Tax=Streptomyces fimbriatus TaxID=68197 RepID=A0ABW0DHF9_STRFI
MSVFRRGRAGPGRVTVREAAARTGRRGAAGGGGAVLLDVRERHERHAGHVPRAVHPPLSAPAAGTGLPPAARARPLVVIRRAGNRSRHAAEPLVVRGADAVDVIGGTEDRAGAGPPVVGRHGGSGTVT